MKQAINKNFLTKGCEPMLLLDSIEQDHQRVVFRLQISGVNSRRETVYYTNSNLGIEYWVLRDGKAVRVSGGGDIR
jgi:hypothetical protein